MNSVIFLLTPHMGFNEQRERYLHIDFLGQLCFAPVIRKSRTSHPLPVLVEAFWQGLILVTFVPWVMDSALLSLLFKKNFTTAWLIVVYHIWNRVTEMPKICKLRGSHL